MAIRSKNKLYAALSQRPIHEAVQHADPEEPMQWCRDMEHHSKTAFQWCEAFSPSIQVLAIIRCNFAPSCSLGSHFWVYLSNERGRNIREILENWGRRSGHGLDLLLVCRHSQQFYSSRSCSPAELRYASNCVAKVLNFFEMAILQFDLLTTSTKKHPAKWPIRRKRLYICCGKLILK